MAPAITTARSRGCIDGGQPPRLIGIAFDCQEVALVPDEAHDVIIPEILTESGLRRFGAGSSA